MCPELGKPGARKNTPSEFLSRQMPPVKVSICSLTATTSSISIFPGTPAGWNSGMAASIGNGKSCCSASATGTLLVIIWWPIWIVRPCEFSVLAELDYPIVEVVGQLSNQMFLHDPPCNLAVGMLRQMGNDSTSISISIGWFDILSLLRPDVPLGCRCLRHCFGGVRQTSGFLIEEFAIC